MILITGANGFIGSHITKLLVSGGKKVRGLVRRTSNLSNLKDILPQIELITGDILDPASLKKALDGVEVCFHTAALVKSGHHPSSDYFSTNLTGTMNICEMAMNAGVKRFIYTSSCETLRTCHCERSEAIPQNKLTAGDCHAPSGLAMTEETVNSIYSNMVGDYGRSKFLAEEHVKACVKHGLPAVILNPTGVVGTGDINLTPPNALIHAYCKGEIPLYFETGFNVVDVRDVASAHVMAMTKGGIGERYTVGNSNVMLSHIFKLLNELSGKKHFSLRAPYFLVAAMLKIMPIKRSWKEKIAASRHPFFLDNSKAMRELGWKPNFELKESLCGALKFKREK